MDLSTYKGKRFTLWLFAEDEEQALFGNWIAEVFNSELVLRREDGTGTLRVEKEWLGRIKATSGEEDRSILLGADFFLPLSVGDAKECLPGGIHTGMTWPSE